MVKKTAKQKKEKKAAKAEKKRQVQINKDLFDNPMVRSALSAMTPEQIEKYKHIGEEMYGGIDFEHSQVLSSMPPPMAEALAYVVESLKSGLHPTDLDEDEINLLKEGYGEEWYKKWGYSEGDLEYIITVKK